jgi:molecular chaperone GrpE (heat shock protein)
VVNFEEELDKLLSREGGELPEYELMEFAALGQEFLSALNRKQTDVSLQIEEIYDLLKEQDTKLLQETLSAERGRSNRLALAAMGLCDLLEDFCAYARQSGSGELLHQAELLWNASGGLLSGCNLIRFGAEGEALNPGIHNVKAGVPSELPREQVVRVLQSGYVYRNVLVRKAAVVVSRGPEGGGTSEDPEAPAGTAGPETAEAAAFPGDPDVNGTE